MTRMAVYGAGGVGGYFGARLARAGAEVHFIARGAHLQALRERTRAGFATACCSRTSSRIAYDRASCPRTVISDRRPAPRD